MKASIKRPKKSFSLAFLIPLLDGQLQYPKAEAVGNFTVFNIKGNNYRLIVNIRYSIQTPLNLIQTRSALCCLRTMLRKRSSRNEIAFFLPSTQPT